MASDAGPKSPSPTSENAGRNMAARSGLASSLAAMFAPTPSGGEVGGGRSRGASHFPTSNITTSAHQRSRSGFNSSSIDSRDHGLGHQEDDDVILVETPGVNNRRATDGGLYGSSMNRRGRGKVKSRDVSHTDMKMAVDGGVEMKISDALPKPRFSQFGRHLDSNSYNDLVAIPPSFHLGEFLDFRLVPAPPISNIHCPSNQFQKSGHDISSISTTNAYTHKGTELDQRLEELGGADAVLNALPSLIESLEWDDLLELSRHAIERSKIILSGASVQCLRSLLTRLSLSGSGHVLETWLVECFLEARGDPMLVR